MALTVQRLHKRLLPVREAFNVSDNKPHKKISSDEQLKEYKVRNVCKIISNGVCCSVSMVRSSMRTGQ